MLCNFHIGLTGPSVTPENGFSTCNSPAALLFSPSFRALLKIRSHLEGSILVPLWPSDVHSKQINPGIRFSSPYPQSILHSVLTPSPILNDILGAKGGHSLLIVFGRSTQKHMLLNLLHQWLNYFEDHKICEVNPLHNVKSSIHNLQPLQQQTFCIFNFFIPIPLFYFVNGHLIPFD